MKLSLKKLDQRGFDHVFLALIVVMVIAVGGTYMLVKSHADPLVSPDTTTSSTAKMVFWTPYEIYTSTGTGTAKGVASSPIGASSTNIQSTYALNGSKIFYFYSNTSINSVLPGGTGAKLAVTLPTASGAGYQSFAWSEKAQKFYAYSTLVTNGHLSDRIVTFGPTGTAMSTIYSPNDSMQDFFGDWSPDGTKIMHSSYDITTSKSFYGYMTASTGALTAIPNNSCYEMGHYEAAWTSDSASLVCVNPYAQGINKVNVATGASTILVTNSVPSTQITGMST